MRCTKCKEDLPVSGFYKRSDGKGKGIQSHCKRCVISRGNIYQKTPKGRESNSRSNKKSYNKNRRKNIARQQKWRAANPEKVRQHLKNFHERHKNEPCYRIKRNLRRRINRYISGERKPGSTISDLGCSIEELKLYIESYFSLYPGMSWNNYGTEWHIDHFIPLTHFDLTCPMEYKEACHYLNLQPLWAVANMKKGSKIGQEI